MAFASPARDFNEGRLDLGQLLPNKSSTYYMRAIGAMPDAGITEGDILVVDKALDLLHGDIAVCWIEHSFILRRVRLQKNKVWLTAGNDDASPVELSGENHIWGIVIMVLKKFR